MSVSVDIVTKGIDLATAPAECKRRQELYARRCAFVMRKYVPVRETILRSSEPVNSDYGAGAYSATYEMAVEATYVIVLNENISIQPDMQYIFRPNGNDDIDDALVLGAQLVVSF